MKTRNFFLRLFSTVVLCTIFVSCATNEEDAVATKNTSLSKPSNDKAESSPVPIFSKHRGTLTVINTTEHEFGHLYFRCFQTTNLNGHTYALHQYVKLAANSSFTLSNYHDSYLLGITDNDNGADTWVVTDYSNGFTTSLVHGFEASNLDDDPNDIHYMTNYLISNEGNETMSSVYWSSMGDNRSRSNDNHVYFRFKFFEETSGEILVNDNQHWTDGTNTYLFTTTASFDGNGNTTITLTDTVQ
jgi:hypothetical protein